MQAISQICLYHKESCLNKIHLRIVLGRRVEAIKTVSIGAEAGKPLMHQLMDKNSLGGCYWNHCTTVALTSLFYSSLLSLVLSSGGRTYEYVSFEHPHSGPQPCTSHVIETLKAT